MNIIRKGLATNELFLMNQLTGEIAFSLEEAIASTKYLLERFPNENLVKMCRWRVLRSDGDSPTPFIYKYFPKQGILCRLLSFDF